MTTITSRAAANETSIATTTEPADAGWRRTAALGGLLFVVLNVAGTIAPGAPPASDASGVKIAGYFTDHAGAIKAQLLLGGLGIALLMWWFGALWRMMSRAEGERPQLAIVAAISLASGLTLAVVSGVFTATAALRVDNIETTHLLYSLSLVVVAAAGFGLGAFLAVTSLLAYRTRFVPRWTAYLGGLAAIAFLISGGGTVSDSSFVNTLGVVAFLIWCVWIVAMSVYMWRGASPAA